MPMRVSVFTHSTPIPTFPLPGGRRKKIRRLQAGHGVIGALDDSMDAGGRATPGAVADAVTESAPALPGGAVNSAPDEHRLKLQNLTMNPRLHLSAFIRGPT